MIYGIIHNKKFKLYPRSCKIRNPYLSEDEKKYIKACVKDIMQYCERNKKDTTEEFIAKNLPDYGIKVIRYFDILENNFLREFLNIKMTWNVIKT